MNDNLLTVREAIAAAPLSIEEKLRWQFALTKRLRFTEADIPFFKAAIQVLNLGLDPDTPLRVPPGKNYLGGNHMPAVVAVKLFRLEVYLTPEASKITALSTALEPFIRFANL